MERRKISPQKASLLKDSKVFEQISSQLSANSMQSYKNAKKRFLKKRGQVIVNFNNLNQEECARQCKEVLVNSKKDMIEKRQKQQMGSEKAYKILEEMLKERNLTEHPLYQVYDRLLDIEKELKKLNANEVFGEVNKQMVKNQFDKLKQKLTNVNLQNKQKQTEKIQPNTLNIKAQSQNITQPISSHNNANLAPLSPMQNSLNKEDSDSDDSQINLNDDVIFGLPKNSAPPNKQKKQIIPLVVKNNKESKQLKATESNNKNNYSQKNQKDQKDAKLFGVTRPPNQQQRAFLPEVKISEESKHLQTKKQKEKDRSDSDDSSISLNDYEIFGVSQNSAMPHKQKQTTMLPLKKAEDSKQQKAKESNKTGNHSHLNRNDNAAFRISKNSVPSNQQKEILQPIGKKVQQSKQLKTHKSKNKDDSDSQMNISDDDILLISKKPVPTNKQKQDVLTAIKKTEESRQNKGKEQVENINKKQKAVECKKENKPLVKKQKNKKDSSSDSDSIDLEDGAIFNVPSKQKQGQKLKNTQNNYQSKEQKIKPKEFQKGSQINNQDREEKQKQPFAGKYENKQRIKPVEEKKQTLKSTQTTSDRKQDKIMANGNNDQFTISLRDSAVGGITNKGIQNLFSKVQEEAKEKSESPFRDITIQKNPIFSNLFEKNVKSIFNEPKATLQKQSNITSNQANKPSPAIFLNTTQPIFKDLTSKTASNLFIAPQKTEKQPTANNLAAPGLFTSTSKTNNAIIFPSTAKQAPPNLFNNTASPIGGGSLFGNQKK